MSTQTTTDNIRKTLDKISSLSFFFSLIASKIQYIPIVTIATPILNLLALSLTFLGYSLWFVASHFYPDHYPKYTEWYGFAPFKEQNTYAAFLGIGAALLSIIAITLPALAIPAAWLFFSSNIIWAIGEYHKLKNPPADESYSKSYQKSYLSYAIAMTSVGLTSAIAATIIFLFPIHTIPVLAVSSLMSIALSIVAAEHWFDYSFGTHKKTPVSEVSHDKMAHGLGPAIENSESPSPAPYHSPRLLEKAKPSPSMEIEIELRERESPTCNLLW